MCSFGSKWTAVRIVELDKTDSARHMRSRKNRCMSLSLMKKDAIMRDKVKERHMMKKRLRIMHSNYLHSHIPPKLYGILTLKQ